MSRSRRIPRTVLSAALTLAAVLLAASCDDGISLLTLDERQALYRAEASAKGLVLPVSAANPGAVLDPAEGLRVSFETLRGSEEPAELVILLRSGSGTPFVSVRYRTGSDASADTEVREVRVSSLASLSAVLEVPPDFPDGYYELILDARSARSESLSHSEMGFFLSRISLPQPSILAYPANPSPGSRVLLVANLTGYEGRDPYLRWTVDGTVRAEGPASSGTDKLLWPAPQVGTPASVGLALYPTAPPAGASFSFPAPRSASAGLLVSPGDPEALDEFSRIGRFRALFRMEDSPDYAGVPGGSGEFLGSPKLDVHPGGFGLVLGGPSGAGIRAPALLLPIQEGRLQPCTVLARLVPTKSAGGVLFRAEAGSEGPSLEINLTENRPIVVLRAGNRSGEVRAGSFLVPSRPVLLGVSLRPEGSDLRVSFLVDGISAGEGVLSFGVSGWLGTGSTTVAGPGGYPGLYDEMGVWAFDDQGGPAVYPAFLFASRRAFGASLVMAEGFEGAYGSPFTLEGGASVETGAGLSLPAGAGVKFDALPDASLDVEAALYSGSVPALIVHGSEGTFAVPWKAETGPDPFSGLPLLRASIRPGGEKGGLSVVSGADTVRIPGSGPWRLGLVGSDPSVSVVRSIRILRSASGARE